MGAPDLVVEVLGLEHGRFVAHPAKLASRRDVVISTVLPGFAVETARLFI